MFFTTIQFAHDDAARSWWRGCSDPPGQCSAYTGSFMYYDDAVSLMFCDEAVRSCFQRWSDMFMFTVQHALSPHVLQQDAFMSQDLFMTTSFHSCSTRSDGWGPQQRSVHVEIVYSACSFEGWCICDATQWTSDEAVCNTICVPNPRCCLVWHGTAINLVGVCKEGTEDILNEL